ncbi:MAG: site-specific DNA-methyltransferase [Dehalobacter sp. 4CP]|nr:site-specific DNA-methyltransferase [Dehalobacter sp. 4CP]
MARKKTIEPNQKHLEQYEHKDKQRLNNPPVGLVDSHTDNGGQKKKVYQYDPHLDPQLQWAGKAEHTSFDVPTVSLHVHERIDPRRIMESVKKEKTGPQQMSLFEEDKKPLREAIEFYKHKENWSNRLIAGDSLLIMNSLLEKEGMGGKVQMIYIDPPYGIKYGSNFQPFVNKRDVKDGKDEDLTAEPEMIKAFRDTWELGIHSYLTYLRDRLLLARELLSESGSIFVQISDENVHHVRELMDEVFGVRNFVSEIIFLKTTGQTSKLIPPANDYLIWYAKSVEFIKYHQLFKERSRTYLDNAYNYAELDNGDISRLLNDEQQKDSFSKGHRFRIDNLTSQSGPGDTLVLRSLINIS